MGGASALGGTVEAGEQAMRSLQNELIHLGYARSVQRSAAHRTEQVQRKEAERLACITELRRVFTTRRKARPSMPGSEAMGGASHRGAGGGAGRRLGGRRRGCESRRVGVEKGAGAGEASGTVRDSWLDRWSRTPTAFPMEAGCARHVVPRSRGGFFSMHSHDFDDVDTFDGWRFWATKEPREEPCAG